MHLSLMFVVLSAFLVISSAQFAQYPPEFQPNLFNSIQQPFNTYRNFGGYQLRYPPPPPHRPNFFDQVYNEKGEKLTCRMVCSTTQDDTTEDVDDSLQKGELLPEKKESEENRIGKKE
ncbi:unnamed protein product [Ceutorhynchus assimilis]|uniref:Uncharacterized protein n=1 Tax=Ceutorhynchus assimilis TaxID=467358 RepID=A0A9N9QGY4_9CUCU|nr:unnamed protein product [Ceutorhynchus assimilis]